MFKKHFTLDPKNSNPTHGYKEPTQVDLIKAVIKILTPDLKWNWISQNGDTSLQKLFSSSFDQINF
jgi:hypothetical protein